MKLRKSVQQFAEAMELKLRENDHKGSWDKCEIPWLIDRIKKEVKELENAYEHRLTDWGRSADEGHFSPTTDEQLIKECADIGNFAMMVASNFDYEELAASS